MRVCAETGICAHFVFVCFLCVDKYVLFNFTGTVLTIFVIELWEGI